MSDGMDPQQWDNEPVPMSTRLWRAEQQLAAVTAERDEARAELAAARKEIARCVNALELIDYYAWSAVRADCTEAAEELNRRVSVCREVRNSLMKDANTTGGHGGDDDAR